MGHADEDVLSKEWDGAGPSMDRPAEMEQIKSCRTLLAADENYFL